MTKVTWTENFYENLYASFPCNDNAEVPILPRNVCIENVLRNIEQKMHNVIIRQEDVKSCIISKSCIWPSKGKIQNLEFVCDLCQKRPVSYVLLTRHKKIVFTHIDPSVKNVEKLLPRCFRLHKHCFEDLPFVFSELLNNFV